MAQVTIYLDDELVAAMRAAAEAAKVSQSRWLAGLIRTRLAVQWPDDVAALAGAWQDFPEPETLRSGPAEDVPREAF